MTTGDPFYCFEHKCFVNICEYEKHSWETDMEYQNRVTFFDHTIPHCPTCTCGSLYPPLLPPL